MSQFDGAPPPTDPLLEAVLAEQLGPSDHALDDDEWLRAAWAATSWPQQERTTGGDELARRRPAPVRVSRQLSAAAAGAARRLEGDLRSPDGRFTTSYREDEGGRLVVAITGPAGYTGLVRLAWAVHPGPAGPSGRRRTLVTPLAEAGDRTEAVYALAFLDTAPALDLVPAEPVDGEAAVADAVRAAFADATPFGNAVRAWQRYLTRPDVPGEAARLVERHLRGLSG